MVKKIFIIILVVILIAVPSLLWINYQNKMAAKVIEENEKYYDLLVDNCECIERERMFCPTGFVLNQTARLCKAEGKYTNVLLGCSQFNCGDEIVSWNNQTKLWEPKLELN